jgi:hypothetical protein
MSRIIGPEHRIVQAVLATATLSTPNTFKNTFCRVAPGFKVEEGYISDVLKGFDRYTATGSFLGSESTVEDLTPQEDEDFWSRLSGEDDVDLSEYVSQPTVKALDPVRSKLREYLAKYSPDEIIACKPKGCRFVADMPGANEAGEKTLKTSGVAFLSWKLDWPQSPDKEPWQGGVTTGNFKHLRDADDSLMFLDGKSTIFAQNFEDLAVDGWKATLKVWVYAVKYVKGREFRFWRHRDGKDDLSWRLTLP